MSEQKKQPRESPGEIRPSQLITTYGPGSIMQVEDDSIMILGLSFWNKDEDELMFQRIHHPELERILKVDHFRMPREEEKMQKSIPCQSFPLWGVCSKCDRLEQHKIAPERGKKQYHCSNCKGDLYPARFVVICDNGHIDDFPWIEWAHSTEKEGYKEACGPNPKLQFYTKGNKQALSDYVVKCLDCDRSRNCGQAATPGSLNNIISSCSGSAPWLGTKSEKCQSSNKKRVNINGIQVRATNIYFPLNVNALFIPKWLHPIQTIIKENKKALELLIGMKPYQIDGVPNFEKIAKESAIFEKEIEEYGIDEVTRQLEDRFTQDTEGMTQNMIKTEEFHDLINAQAGYKSGTVLEINDEPIADTIQTHFSRMKKLNRLTEVDVLKGFARKEAPDPFSSQQNIIYQKLSRRKVGWYPGVENRGEGFLFNLNEDLLQKWESQKEIIERTDIMKKSFEEWAKERQWKPEGIFGARYMLLHSLSHALIRGLEIYSGYPTPSIKERIYAGNDFNGILIYTSSTSSDGSLGGLVKQSSTDDFKKLLQVTKIHTKHCSRDPLCSEEDPKAKFDSGFPAHLRYNGSACYGCVLLPETCCENSNRLLDRKLLFDEEFGFLKDLKS